MKPRMTSVIAFPAHRAQRPRPDESLVTAIVQKRWPDDSVFWLKETAEILQVLDESDGSASPLIRAALEAPLAGLFARLTFFPQYYRFFLSIAVSARSLGLMDPGHVEQLVQWVGMQGWQDSELADLNRAEARHLLRRGGWDRDEDPDLDRRLRRFLDRPATFAIPNRKAAYELTHLIFYLSDYGRRNPDLSPAALQSLRYAGTLAYLDQNADLLAELCLCMVYAGQDVPPTWLSLVEETAKGFAFEAKPGMVDGDDCHCLLVCNWLLGRLGHPAFQIRIPELNAQNTLIIRAPLRPAAPLRELSVFLLGLGEGRGADWTHLRSAAVDALSPAARDVLWQAEAADDQFAGFFAAFARSQTAGQTGDRP
jgi:hypothetical protein